MSELTDRKGRWLPRAVGKASFFLSGSRPMGAIPATRRSCMIPPERRSGRSRSQRRRRKIHPHKTDLHKIDLQKISGRSGCQERIGQRAVILWLYAALLLPVKVRK